jgi:hypothetical protein
MAIGNFPNSNQVRFSEKPEIEFIPALFPTAGQFPSSSRQAPAHGIRR